VRALSLEVRNTGEIDNVWLANILYGASKSGKTSLAATLGDKPLVIDFDEGLLTLRELRVNYLQPRTWEEVLELTTLVRSGKLREKVDFDHLIWDSHTFFYALVMEGVLRISKRAQPQIQDWGLANERVKLVYEQLRRARSDQKYHFTLVCHERTDKDENTGRIVGGINATPALMAVVPAMFDEMYYLAVSAGPQNTVKRGVWTVQNGFFPAGSRSRGRLLPVEEPDLRQIYGKIISQGGK